MSQQELVRVRVGDREFNVGAAYAKAKKLEVLKDEATHLADGSPRPETARGGRPVKPTVSVAEAAASKAAVIDSESAPNKKG
ncbi:MAG: hypothetical protein ACRDPS_01485 [Nocardioides sp.]|uniref:hypothetical protein n=1 Tax=Nocardioides sp. TaxID=35761 RepID=UPI003D6C1AAF